MHWVATGVASVYLVADAALPVVEELPSAAQKVRAKRWANINREPTAIDRVREAARAASSRRSSSFITKVPTLSVHGQIEYRARDRCRERGRFGRLRDVRVESCLERACAIFGARIAGQRHGGKTTALLGFMPTNLTNQGVAVLARQVDIAHQRVGTRRLDCQWSGSRMSLA